MRVKICGIQTIEEAHLAVSFGADSIGFLVGQKHQSPDFISIEQARRIALALPPFVASTLVTHFDEIEAIGQMISFVRPDVVQVYSEMSPRGFSALRDQGGRCWGRTKLTI